jgi:hypothetical protein
LQQLLIKGLPQGFTGQLVKLVFDFIMPGYDETIYLAG